MPHATVDVDPTDAGNEPGEGPLRAGGRAPGTSIKRKEDLPSTLSKAAKRQQSALKTVRDLLQGAEVVKEAATTYLPRDLGEDIKDYRARLERSVFFNAYRRTVEGLAGLVFASDPNLGDDVPDPIAEHWENIDNEGTHGDVFARELFEDAMGVGHAAIFVEFPKTNGEQTKAPEMSGDIRPYWIPIRKDDIMSWRTMRENGQRVLSQVVLRERLIEPVGMFGEREVEQFRVLFRRREENTDQGEATVGFIVLRIKDDKSLVVEEEGTYPTQDEIPIVEVPTSGKRDLFDSDPPLMDLAWLNIAHYQQQSDFDWSKHKTCVPIFVASGFPQQFDEAGNRQALELGPNSALTSEDPQASAEYVAHSGQSLENCQKALQELKGDMGTLGLNMLAPDKRAAETARAKRIDKAVQDSALAVSARALQDSIENALQFHANYMRLEDGGSVEIERDFERLTLEASVMAAYAKLIDSGLPIETALRMLQRGGRIPEDADIEELAMQMAAEAMAREEQEREEAEAGVQSEVNV